jgi:hypothetical protein
MRGSDFSNPENLKKAISDAFTPNTPDQVEPQLLRLINWQRIPSIAMKHIRDVSQVKRLRLDASALRKDLSFEDSKESTIGPTGV